jgi:hypothetical protein
LLFRFLEHRAYMQTSVACSSHQGRARSESLCSRRKIGERGENTEAPESSPFRRGKIGQSRREICTNNQCPDNK